VSAHNPMRAVAAVALSLAAGVAPAQPAADPARVVLDLKAVEGRIVALSAEGVTIRDEMGRTVTVASPLAVVTKREATGETPSQALRGSDPLDARLHLVDRQVFPGRPASEPAGLDRMSWETPWGPRTMPLELAGLIRLGAVPPRALGTGSTADRVVLTNGDIAEGFVAEVGPTVRVERDAGPAVLPIDRVAAVAFANPAQEPRGAYMWFVDGSVAAVTAVSVDGTGQYSATLRIDPTGAPARGSWTDVRAVLFDASRLRALALAPPPRIVPQDAASRRWTPPAVIAPAMDAPLFAADIELPGPMTLEWELPSGAARFVAEVEMPPHARVWGDCEIAIAPAGQPEVFRARLSGSSPSASVDVALASRDGASRLIVRLEQGAGGPVQDRVVLRRPMIVVNPPR
jgi:hypothetical protein